MFYFHLLSLMIDFLPRKEVCTNHLDMLYVIQFKRAFCLLLKLLFRFFPFAGQGWANQFMSEKLILELLCIQRKRALRCRLGQASNRQQEKKSQSRSVMAKDSAFQRVLSKPASIEEKKGRTLLCLSMGSYGGSKKV